MFFCSIFDANIYLPIYLSVYLSTYVQNWDDQRTIERRKELVLAQVGEAPGKAWEILRELL